MRDWTVVCVVGIAVLSGRTVAEQAGKPSQTDPKAVGDDLAVYYAKGKQPPWREAMKGLAAKDASRRERAAQYLVALLDQALKDELSGKAPWRATPFWGSGGENPARELRKTIAEALAKAEGMEAALPVYRWLLDHERLAGLKPAAAKGLLKVRSKKGDEALVKLVAPAHPNAVVVVIALAEIEKRKLVLPKGALAGLCQHHRRRIRDAARRLAATLGHPKAAKFDAVAAMKSEPIRKLMAGLSEVVLESAPDDAPFAVITMHYPKAERGQDTEVRGWLLRETEDHYAIFTPYAKKNTIPKRRDDKNWPMTATMARLDIAKEVQRVAKLRAEGNPDFSLSERGGLTGQFRGGGAGLYEILLSHWLYKTKRYALCAEILPPALETLYADEHLVDLARDRLGDLYGYRMLAAFAGDRDYARTLELARGITKHFKNTRFSRYVAGLQEQLPKRRSDFTTMVLPTPAEWKALKEKLSREKQIQFFCDRMRLLNCFQGSQPQREVSYVQPQYREPSGMSDDASWGGGPGKTEVVNPYVQLTGKRSWRDEDEKVDHLNLTPADILTIAPYLHNDWYIPTVSFWRDFHPSRNLHSTRELFTRIIDHAAGQEICYRRGDDWRSPKGREAIVARIMAWARDNAGASRATLLLRALEKELAGEKDWDTTAGQAGELVELKETKAVALMLRFIEDKATDGWTIQPVLAACAELDLAAAKAASKRFLTHDSLKARTEAGLIFLRAGDVAPGRKAIGKALDEGDDGNMHASDVLRCVLALLDEGSAQSRKTAATVLRPGLLEPMSLRRSVIAQAFIKAGMPDAYVFYQQMLRTRTSTTSGSSYADEIIDDLVPDDPEIKRIARETKGDEDKQIAALQEWLKKKIAALKTKTP